MAGEQWRMSGSKWVASWSVVATPKYSSSSLGEKSIERVNRWENGDGSDDLFAADGAGDFCAGDGAGGNFGSTCANGANG